MVDSATLGLSELNAGTGCCAGRYQFFVQVDADLTTGTFVLQTSTSHSGSVRVSIIALALLVVTTYGFFAFQRS